MDEELSRKILGVMQSSSVTPLKFVLVPGKVQIYVRDKLLTEIAMALFAHLTPHEILKLAGIPIQEGQQPWY